MQSTHPRLSALFGAGLVCAGLVWFPLFAYSSPTDGGSEPVNPFTGEALTTTLASLPDTARIDFVNDNFYKIYSADFDMALLVSEEALILSSSLGDSIRTAYSAMHHGLANAFTGQLDRALEFYLRSRRIFEEENHVDGLKLLKFEMAVFYRRQGNIDQSIELLDYVEQMSRATNDDMNLARALGYRGTIFAQQGDMESARPYYEEVYRLRMQLADSIGLGYALLDMASLELAQRNFPEAYRYVDSSIAVRKAIGDMQGLAISTLARGETLYAEGRYEEAFPYYAEAQQMARSLGYSDLARYIYDRYIDIHETLGNYQEALDFLRRRTALADSLFNVERVRVVQELNTRFETERRDRQIAELEREKEINELVIQRNRVMTSGLGVTLLLVLASGLLWKSRVTQRELEYRVRALEFDQKMQHERERISRDLHDHVGAQLVNIISGLSLVERFTSGTMPARTDMNEKELLASLRQEAQHTIKQLRDTIWTLSSNEISPEAFQEYLGNYIQQFRAMTGIQTTVHYDEHLAEGLSPARALNIFRIIQEALQNAAKHSGCDRIEISFCKDNQSLVGKIRDNGVFKSAEVRLDGGGSGIGNMRKRALEMDGTLEVDGGESGTEVRFTLPLQQEITVSFV